MQVTETLRRAREKYRDATINEELEMMFQMYLLDPNEAIVQLVTNQLRNMSLNPNILPSGGGTDANAMRLNGVECVVGRDGDQRDAYGQRVRGDTRHNGHGPVLPEHPDHQPAGAGLASEPHHHFRPLPARRGRLERRI